MRSVRARRKDSTTQNSTEENSKGSDETGMRRMQGGMRSGYS